MRRIKAPLFLRSSLRNRLVAGFMVALLTLTVVVGVVIASMARIGSISTQVTRSNELQMHEIMHLQRVLPHVEDSLNAYVLTGAVSERREYENNVTMINSTFSKLDDAQGHNQRSQVLLRKSEKV